MGGQVKNSELHWNTDADSEAQRRAAALKLLGLGFGLVGAAAFGAYVAHRRGASADGATSDRVRAQHVEESATIRAPIADVYQFWRQFSFAQQMRHLDSVQVIDDRRSRWRVRLPGGALLEWDAIISDELPDERLAWRSEPDAPIVHAGTVQFSPAPGGQGTELRVSFTYEPPGGTVGALAAWLGSGLLESQVRADLRRCKQVIETGEVLLSGAPS